MLNNTCKVLWDVATRGLAETRVWKELPLSQFSAYNRYLLQLNNMKAAASSKDFTSCLPKAKMSRQGT